MASRRYRSKNTLNSNISNIDNRLQNLETRPSPRRIAANAIGSAQLQEESVVEGSIAPGIVDGTLIAGGSVGSAQIQDLIITENKIFDGAISTIKIAANAITEAQLAANSVTSAIVAANAITNDKIIANAITNIKIAANAVTGNNILANSVPGSVVIADTLLGNTIIANSLLGNTIIANTLSGNTVIANTLSGNTVVANTLSGNTVVANTLSGNTILANTLSGNTVIANTISGNTIIANSLQGNTIVANTLFGNSIVAGSLTGDRITGTTSIRLADSLLASPTNFIQFGYVTPAGQASPVPGIYGYYGGYPSFYIGGWDRPVDGYADAGVSFGVYDYHTSTPVSMMNLYYEDYFSAGTQQVVFTTGGFGIYVDGYDTVNPVIGDIHFDTNSGTGSVRVSLNQTPDVYGTYPALVTDGPIRLSMSPVTLSLTSDNHGITVGVNQTGIPNQYSVAISDRAIQARLAQGASTLTLNALGGDIELGGQLRIKAGFSDATLTSTAHPFQIGDTSGVNLRIDNNEVQAVNNGSAATLNLNIEGGNVALGNATTSTITSGAIYNNGLSGTTRDVFVVNTTGGFALGYLTSNRDAKQDISLAELDTNLILGIEPKSFRYKSDVTQLGNSAPVILGFIAEDFVEAGLEKMVYRNDDTGAIEGINYQKFVIALQAVARNQAAKIASLESRISALEN